MAEHRVRCLIVDDEAKVRDVMARILVGGGFECRQAASAAEAVAILEQEPFDLAVLDIQMPVMDGTQLLAEVRLRWPETGVVMVTAVSEVRTAVACLTHGAVDYIAKPFEIDEVRARIRQALEKRRLLRENREYQLHLEQRVKEQATRIEELFVLGVHSLVQALEAKDQYTRGHSARVAVYAVGIARELGLDEETQTEIRLGGELHDIGKIGVREAVLGKPGPLTEEEYLHVMGHPAIGERILAPLLKEHPLVLSVVRSHHERLDGAGLPDHLQGDLIPLVARLASVADAFDAITTGRPYMRLRPPEEAIAELRRCVGWQFDRDCIEAFSRAFPDIARLPIPTPEVAPFLSRG
ncbi:MAG: HD domain-containing phosphohydrolase [Gemmatimonadota bacterium]